MAVAINLEIEENGNPENVSTFIEKTSKFLVDVQNIDLNDKSKFYDLYDNFIIKIQNIVSSKNLKKLIWVVITIIITKTIENLTFSPADEKVSNIYIDNSSTTNNYTTNNNAVNQSGVVKENIFCSTQIKELKKSKDVRSKTIIKIPVGTKFRVLKRYRTWLWVRVLDGNEFPDGFIKNSDLYLYVN